MKTRTNPRTGAIRGACTVVVASGLLSACGGDDFIVTNDVPANVTQLGVTVYPATTPGSGTTAATQDLLTGGLGKTGLGSAAVPTYADPLNPTALELRRNALHGNYRAIVDPTAAGGYGVLYGPNVSASGVVTASEGMVPGREYVAVLDNAAGTKRTTIVVQIPDSFDQAAPCLVLGPSSGSRGVYGAISTAGEWGLKRGCAVALSDVGKGVGLHDLSDDTVNRIDGTRATRTAAGSLSNFAASVTDAARTAYLALFPNRVALKQVHSQQNPEKDWGTDTLAAASYAFYALNDRYGVQLNPIPFNPGNTLVIAGSASNGGAAVLRAAEQDSSGLIDGVVAGLPVIEIPTATGYGITVGGVAQTGVGKTLADYVTYANVYQPCAALSAPATMAEASVFNYLAATLQTSRATARCDSLAAKGLVSGASTAARSLDALQKLRSYGWTPEHDQMHSSHYGLGNSPILSAMYTTGYGRFSVTENVCGTSFAQVDGAGAPIPLVPAQKAQSFAIANGTANGVPVSVVYNDAVGGPRVWNAAVSPSTGVQDFGLDFALCQRALVTGVDETGAALTATASASRPTAAQSAAVRAGIAEVLFDGSLRGKPTLVVTGRSDALVPPNNNARAYVALNKVREGNASRVSYVEVMNAQHFDAFIPFSGFDNRFIPIHVYFVRAMDAMYAHLRTGTALPPSQVVRATARGGAPGAAPPISAANVPPISAAPVAADQIGFSGTTLAIPN